MRNLENIGHIVVGTVQKLMLRLRCFKNIFPYITRGTSLVFLCVSSSNNTFVTDSSV